MWCYVDELIGIMGGGSFNKIVRVTSLELYNYQYEACSGGVASVEICSYGFMLILGRKPCLFNFQFSSAKASKHCAPGAQ